MLAFNALKLLLDDDIKKNRACKKSYFSNPQDFYMVLLGDMAYPLARWNINWYGCPYVCMSGHYTLCLKKGASHS